MIRIRQYIIYILLTVLSFNFLSSGIGHMLHHVVHLIQDDDFHVHVHNHSDHTHVHHVHSDHDHGFIIQQILDVVDISEFSRLRYLSLLMSTLKCALPDATLLLVYYPYRVQENEWITFQMQGRDVDIPTPPPKPCF